MFYAHDVLTKKGKLGIIWLAATYKGNKSKYLTSKDFKKVNIIKACEYIINPRLPFALRLSSTLMVGLVRVYNEQTRIVLIEANEMMKAVKAAITEQKIAADLKLKQPEQRQESITLPLLLDYEFDLPECQEQIHTDYLVTFAKSNKYFQLPKVKSPELHLPSPITSPGQRISTEEEKSPYQANRKDITIPEIDFNVTAEEEIKIPGEIDIVEPLPYEEIELLEEPGGKTTPKHSLSPLKVTEVPGDESDVMIFDEKTGALKPEGTPTRGTRITHDEGTPQQAGIERQVPDRPVRARRKRKLAVDFTIKLTGLAMRKNLNNVDALKKRKICDIPELPSLKDLFTSPATSVVHGPLRYLWESNAKIRPLKDLHWTVPEPTYSSPIIHDELSSGLDESPTSGIELLRAASHLSTDFERSAGMDTTPEVSAILERSRRSRDLSFSGDRKMDVSTGTPSKPYSRLSTADRLSILSPIADRDEDIPELAVPLEDIEEHLSLDESDQDRISDDATYETIRTIKEVMGDNLMIKLSSAIPYATKRKYAAKLFYNVIALTNIGVLALVQDRPYGEIVIGRGRQY